MHTFYGVSTLTDAHSRESTNGDGLTRSRHLETVCVRSPHVQTECLHDATVCLHIETVCVHKSAHVHVFIRHFKSRAHMTFPIGLVHAGPCACPHISHWLVQYSNFNLNLCILGLDIYIYFIPSLFRIV